MSDDPENEGVVLVAYGSEPYDEEWTQLLEQVGAKLKAETGVETCRHSWCGHIVRYKTEPTETAIKDVLDEKERAIVIPVLVAVDEAFQGKIIGGAVKNVDAGDRVRYRHDAILPDLNVNSWVVQACREFAAGSPSDAVALATD